MASRPAFDVKQLRELDSHDQSYWLIDWFGTTYFDPEEERRSNISRNYRWPPSGPIDPLEELILVFGQEVDRSTLEYAAAELASRSTNWHSRPDEARLREAPRSGRPFRVGDRSGMRLWIDPEEYRIELLEKISLLEAAVADIQVPLASYSHNGPPGPLDDGPVTRKDIAELSSAIAALRLEAQAPQPMPAALTKQSNRLLAFGQKAAIWSGERVTKFVDSALDTAGKTTGATFVLSVAGLLPHLHEVAAAVGRLIESLAH